MTPNSLHGDFAAAFTPLDHGMMTPQHPSIDQIESIPNLPVDQVSHILNGTEMDGFANMGYDDSHQIGGAGMSERVPCDWNDDYDFPPSVVAPVSTKMSVLWFNLNTIIELSKFFRTK